MSVLRRAQRRPTTSPTASGRLALRCALAAFACALAFAGAVGAVPARAAGTPYVDGISDQNLGSWEGEYEDASGLFSPVFDSFFADAWVGVPGAQHLQYARYVTSPDAIAQGGACEANLVDWFTYVTQTLHLIPVIAVWDVAEGGCADHGQPSSAAYTADISQLVTYLDSLYPGANVGDIEAWNEPNSSNVSAVNAASYWIDANSVCAANGCTAIAGDFVDNDPDQPSPSFNAPCPPLSYEEHLATYESAYIAALGGVQPAIWGFHPYYAVNCEQSTSVTTFENGLPAPPPGAPSAQVWFTEVAAWECLRGQPSARGVTQQQADAQYLVDTLMSPSALPTPPAHVFYYEMAAPGYVLACSKYTDSELYEANSAPGPLVARPAAATIYGNDTSLAADTGSPSAVSSTQATFNGTLTPGGIYEASYHFLYGPTMSYGSQTPSVSIGPGLAPVAVSATVGGLAPGTAYHYQLAVTDTNGATVYGPDVVMAPVVVSASPATVTAGRPITVSWSGISNPSAGDWIGLYQPGAPDSSFVDWFYADSCTQTSSGAAAPASGSCAYTMPATAGSYQFQLYTAAASGLLTTSNPITSVPPPPVEAAAPQISGEGGGGRAYVGDTLSCSDGAWSNAPTLYSYAWASDGAVVAGAAGQTLVVPPVELGHALACSVTASNAGGAGTPAVSAAVPVVSPQPVSSTPPSIAASPSPSILGNPPPSISGRAVVGERLGESHAHWSNGPTSYSYQWQRCDRSGARCRSIAGAKGRTYTLTAADVGSTIRVLETASNARAKSAPSPSHVTAVVEPLPPNTQLRAETIDAGAASASFRFAATGSSTGFQCALVRKPAAGGARMPAPVYAACGASITYRHLSPGGYEFFVRATGAGGADRTPATYSFTIV
jgi:hypothetical protein